MTLGLKWVPKWLCGAHAWAMRIEILILSKRKDKRIPISQGNI